MAKEEKKEVKQEKKNFVPKHGDKIKTAKGESPAWDKTETVKGIHEGKKAKFSPIE